MRPASVFQRRLRYRVEFVLARLRAVQRVRQSIVGPIAERSHIERLHDELRELFRGRLLQRPMLQPEYLFEPQRDLRDGVRWLR